MNVNAATRLNLIVNTAIIPELFWPKVDMIVNTAIIPELFWSKVDMTVNTATIPELFWFRSRGLSAEFWPNSNSVN